MLWNSSGNDTTRLYPNFGEISTMSLDTRLRRVAEQGRLKCADVRFGSATSRQHFQFTAPDADVPDQVDPDERRYLVASITKPIVAMGILSLAADGWLSLTQRVGDLLPNFSRGRYRRITVHHLLTHTSGFPDMLPNNTELRAAHADLPEFLKHAADAELDFRTGTDCRYSSVGYLLQGAMIEKIAGMSLHEFLHHKFFAPLQMRDTQLGLTDDEADHFLPTVLPSILPDWQPDADSWGWNSRYWRSLGAPWGGMMTTAGDLGRFAAMLLSEGCSPTGMRVLPSAVVAAAIANQSCEYEIQPEFTGPRRSWGLGWRRQWATHSASFGDFVSAETVGHWGATGTMMWVDPCAKRYAVVLTTTPYEDSRWTIQQMSNVASASERHRSRDQQS